MRTLLLAPVPLSRPTCGVRVRGRALIKSLEALSCLETLCFSSDDEAGDCPRPRPPGFFERLLSPQPSLLRCFQSKQFFHLVSERAQGVDLVLGLGLQMAPYQQCLAPKQPFVLDNFNVESDILERLADQRRGIKRLFWKFQAWKLRRQERHLLSRVGCALAISEADRRRFRQLVPGCPVELVPPGLDLAANLASPPLSPGFNLVFVGALDWHVNVSAATWMAREILPNIQRAAPQATLNIVGRSPLSEVLQLAQIPGVNVYADVPEVLPYLQQAQVIVAPIRFGSGVQNKVIEGLATGRPVVTTPIGLEGLDLAEGQDILVARDGIEFARHCAGLLLDPAWAERVGSAGRARVAASYTLEAFRSNLGRALARVWPH